MVIAVPVPRMAEARAPHVYGAGKCTSASGRLRQPRPHGEGGSGAPAHPCRVSVTVKSSLAHTVLCFGRCLKQTRKSAQKEPQYCSSRHDGSGFKSVN